MREGSKVEQVRALWDTFQRGGVDAMAGMVDPDVVWEPLAGDGRAFHGIEELREYFESSAARGREQEARAYRFEERGSCVLVTGSFRVSQPDGSLEEMQPAWVYFYEGERLVRCVGYPSTEAAEAAMAAHRRLP